MRTEYQINDMVNALDAAPLGFILIGTDYTIRAVNRRAQDLHGSPLVGRKCHEALNRQTDPCGDCMVDEIVRRRAPVFRFRELERDPHAFTCRHAYPVFYNGAVDTVAVVEFDPSIDDEIEGRLQLSSAFLRNLILSSVDGVIASDMTGKILVFNQAAVEITGYSMEEALTNLNIRDVYQNDGARDIMRKLREDGHGGRGKLKSCKVNVLRKDGEIIPINLNASIVYEGDKEAATIGFFHDMREELEMRKKLENTQIQLLQAEKMSSLGKLSAGVAHQLNNPLGGITLYTNLLLEEEHLAPGVRDNLNRILQETQRCADTVKELLEFARQTSRQVRPHDLNQVILRTLFLLEKQTLFQNIAIHKDLDQELPRVDVDIQQINHVFMNLILNAAQAMDGKGELRISTRAGEGDGTVTIRIADTGPGIPDDVLPHIFEPFYTTKKAGEGTGLGLSMVYGIVERHHGRISVESRPGQGAAFVITLPAKAPSREEGDDGAE